MNTAAQALGRLARGVPKTLSAEQREAKRRTLAANRASITPAENKARMAKAWATRRAKQAQAAREFQVAKAARALELTAMTTQETLDVNDAIIQRYELLNNQLTEIEQTVCIPNPDAPRPT